MAGFDLAVAALTASIAGTGVSAISAIQQGRYQQKVSEHAAKGAEIEARQAYLDEVSNLKTAQELRRARIGTMASQIASSGVGLEGAPLYLLEEAKANLLTEQQRMTQELVARQQKLTAQGTLLRAEGSMARTAGLYGGIGGALSGIGSAYSIAKDM